ncbi:metal-dependent hydrolase [Chloroflexota bacterium]
MLVLAHTGITLGAALALNRLFPKNSRTPGNQATDKSPGPTPASRQSKTASWLNSLADRIDIRLLLIGAMLPDIIDKPIGHFFFQNGRIFSHTLLFFLIVASAGVWIYLKSRKTPGLTLAFGMLTHLILDKMWLTPQTLFWPLYGFAFGRIDLTDWASNIFYSLLNSPQTYAPETIGGVILGWLGLVLLRRRRLWAFLKQGKVA